MAEFHLHLEGTSVDHVEWTTTGDDDFDAEALENAIAESRRRLYDELHDLDAA